MSLSEWYAVAAAVALAAFILLNSPWVMLIGSALGVIAGFILGARGSLKRGGMFAFVAFILAGALAIFSLMRAR